jgi:hypothetical protein
LGRPGHTGVEPHRRQVGQDIVLTYDFMQLTGPDLHGDYRLFATALVGKAGRGIGRKVV